MTSLTQSVQEAIKEKLPAVVAGELANFIEQANKDKKELEEKTKVIEKLSLKMVEVEGNLIKSNNTLKAYTDLENREKEVEKRENALELTLAKAELLNAVERVKTVERLAEIAFKNPRLIHSASGQLPYNGGAMSGGSGTVQLHSYTEESKA